MAWFDGFTAQRFNVNGVEIFARFGGDRSKPALLFLHGFPQSHVLWHRVQQQLQQDYFRSCSICVAMAICPNPIACQTAHK